jgi:hypothetical protein
MKTLPSSAHCVADLPRCGREKPRFALDPTLARLDQQEAPRAVGRLRLARLGAELASQSSLLVPHDRKHREVAAEDPASPGLAR